MFQLLGNKSIRNLPIHRANEDDFERIQREWVQACKRENRELPKKVLEEFKKRMKFASKDKANKAKLNFSKCGLDDQLITLLLEILAVRPVIAKLNLSGNYISDKAAIALIRLLIHQAQQVRTYPPDVRVDAIYISDVDLDQNKSTIQEAVLSDILTVSQALAHENVKNLYAKVVKNYIPITRANVPTIWKLTTGEEIRRSKFEQYISCITVVSDEENLGPDSPKPSSKSDSSAPVYSVAQLETTVINELVAFEALTNLTPLQLKLICYFPKAVTPTNNEYLLKSATPNNNKYLNFDESMNEEQKDGDGTARRRSSNNVLFAIPIETYEGSAVSSDIVRQVVSTDTPQRLPLKNKSSALKNDSQKKDEEIRDGKEENGEEVEQDEGVNRILSSSKARSETSEDDIKSVAIPMPIDKLDDGSDADKGGDTVINLSQANLSSPTLIEREESEYRVQLAKMFPDADLTDMPTSEDSMSVGSGVVSVLHIRRRSSDLSSCDMDTKKKSKGLKSRSSLDLSVPGRELERKKEMEDAILALSVGIESETSTPPLYLEQNNRNKNNDNSNNNDKNKNKNDNENKNKLYQPPKNMPFSPLGQGNSDLSPFIIKIDPIRSNPSKFSQKSYENYNNNEIPSPPQAVTPGLLDNLNEQSIHDSFDYSNNHIVGRPSDIEADDFKNDAQYADKKLNKKNKKNNYSRGNNSNNNSINTDRNEDVTSPIGAVLSDIEGECDDLNNSNGYESGMAGDYSCMQETSALDDDSSTDYGSDSTKSDDKSKSPKTPRSGGHNISIDDFYGKSIPPPTPHQRKRENGTDALLSAFSDVPEGEFDPTKDSVISAAEIDELINNPDQISAFKTRLNNRRLYSALRRVHNPNGTDSPRIGSPTSINSADTPVGSVARPDLFYFIMKDLKVPDYLQRRSKGAAEGEDDDEYDEGEDYSDIQSESDDDDEEGGEREIELRMSALPLASNSAGTCNDEDEDDDDEASELTVVRVKVDTAGLEEGTQDQEQEIAGAVKGRKGADGLSLVRVVHINLEGKEKEMKAAADAEALSLSLSKGRDSASLTAVRAAKVDIAAEEKRKAALTLCKGTNKGDIASLGREGGVIDAIMDDAKNERKIVAAAAAAAGVAKEEDGVSMKAPVRGNGKKEYVTDAVSTEEGHSLPSQVKSGEGMPLDRSAEDKELLSNCMSAVSQPLLSAPAASISGSVNVTDSSPSFYSNPSTPDKNLLSSELEKEGNMDTDDNENKNAKDINRDNDIHIGTNKNTYGLDFIPGPRTPVTITPHASRHSLSTETSNIVSVSPSPAKVVLPLRRSFNRMTRGVQPLYDIETAVQGLESESKDGTLDYKDCYLAVTSPSAYFAESNPITTRSRTSFIQPEFSGPLGERMKIASTQSLENEDGEGEDDREIDMANDMSSAFANCSDAFSDTESEAPYSDSDSESDSDEDEHKFDFKRKISVRDRNLQNGARKGHDASNTKNTDLNANKDSSINTSVKNIKKHEEKTIEIDNGTFEVDFEVEVEGSNLNISNPNQINLVPTKNSSNDNQEFSKMLPSWQSIDITENSDNFPESVEIYDNDAIYMIKDDDMNVNNMNVNNMMKKGNKSPPLSIYTNNSISNNDNNQNSLANCGTQTSTRNNTPQYSDNDNSQNNNKNKYNKVNGKELFSPHSPSVNAFFSPPYFSYPPSPNDINKMMKVGLKDNVFTTDPNSSTDNDGNRTPDKVSHVVSAEDDNEEMNEEDSTILDKNEKMMNENERSGYESKDDDSVNNRSSSLIENDHKGDDLDNAKDKKLNQNQNISDQKTKVSKDETKERRKSLVIDTFSAKDERRMSGVKQPWIRSCSPYAPGGRRKSHSQILTEVYGKVIEKEKDVTRERLRSLTKDQMANEAEKAINNIQKNSNNSNSINKNRRFSQSPSAAVRNSLLPSPDSLSFNLLNSPTSGASGRFSLLESPTSAKKLHLNLLDSSSPKSAGSPAVSVLGSPRSSVGSNLSKVSVSSRSHSRDHFSHLTNRPVPDPFSQSRTIIIPEEINNKNSPLKTTKIVLNLSSQELETFSGLNFKLYPTHNFQLLKVLILRDNYISSLNNMNLRKLIVLTDLDLSYNKLTGKIPLNIFPSSLERLDLTGNKLDNVNGLINCTKLTSLNVSQNSIKVISAYPKSVTTLDLSYNLIMNIIDLRVLSLTPGITTLNIIGNPVSNNSLSRVTVCSVLPKLLSLDDYIIPGRTVRKKSVGRRSSDFYSINDDRSVISNISKKSQTKSDLNRSNTNNIKKKEMDLIKDKEDKNYDKMSKSNTIDKNATNKLINRLSSSNNKNKNDNNIDNKSNNNNKNDINNNNDLSATPRKHKFLKKGEGIEKKDKETFAVFGKTKNETHGRSVDLKEGRKSSIYHQNNEHQGSRRDSNSTHMSFLKSLSCPSTEEKGKGKGKDVDDRRYSNVSEISTGAKELSREFKTAVSSVNKWLLDCMLELGRASMVLGLILWMTEQNIITLENQLSFTAAIDRIPFIRNNRSSVKGTTLGDCNPEGKNGDYIGGHVRYVQLDDAMNEVASSVTQGEGDEDVHQSLIAAVTASEHNISAFASVLIQMEEALMQTIASESNLVSPLEQVQGLRKEVEEIMFSPQGQLLNEHVLTPFGCQLIWEDETILPAPKVKGQIPHPSPWTPRLKGNAGFFPPVNPKPDKEKSRSGRFSPPQESEEPGSNEDSDTSPIKEVILKLKTIRKSFGNDEDSHTLSETAFKMPSSSTTAAAAVITSSPTPPSTSTSERKSKEHMETFIIKAKSRISSGNSDSNSKLNSSLTSPMIKKNSVKNDNKIVPPKGSGSVYASPNSISKPTVSRSTVQKNDNNNINNINKNKKNDDDDKDVNSIAAVWALSADEVESNDAHLSIKSPVKKQDKIVIDKSPGIKKKVETVKKVTK